MEIKKLKTEIKRKGLTYETLSAESGIPLNTLKNIFSGRTPNPRIDTVQAIEKALGLASPTLEWTEEETEKGARAGYNVFINAEEDDILNLYRELIKKKGEPAHKALLTIIEIMKNS